MEPTPNPNSYKITLAVQILTEDMWESDDPQSDCLLARAIFEKAGIARVFIHDNLIVVTKHPNQDWDSIREKIEHSIRDFFEQQLPVFEIKTEDSDQNDYIDLVREVIRDYIQPAVAADGGFIRLKSVENGIVTISMHGACSSCPSSHETLKGGIERILKFRIPGIISVELAAN